MPVNALVVILITASLAACSADDSDLVVKCGPLDAIECREETVRALSVLGEDSPDKGVTRIEFLNEAGDFTFTLSDGTQGWIGF